MQRWWWSKGSFTGRERAGGGRTIGPYIDFDLLMPAWSLWDGRRSSVPSTWRVSQRPGLVGHRQSDDMYRLFLVSRMRLMVPSVFIPSYHRRNSISLRYLVCAQLTRRFAPLHTAIGGGVMGSSVSAFMSRPLVFPTRLSVCSTRLIIFPCRPLAFPTRPLVLLIRPFFFCF